MEKRVLIAAGVSVLILLAWNVLFPPSTPPHPQAEPQAAAAPGPEPAAPEAEAAEAPERPAAPEVGEPVAAGAESAISIATELFELTLSNRGAVVTSWKLKDDTTGGEPLELIPHFREPVARTLAVVLDDAALSRELDEALYRVQQSEGEGEHRVTFDWADGRGLEVHKTLTIRERSYLVDVAAEVNDRGRRQPVKLLLGPGFGERSAGLEASRGTYYYEAVQWNLGGHVFHRKKGSIDENEGLSGPVRWAGLEDQYFAALLLPASPEARVAWRTVKLTHETAAAEPKEPAPESFPVVEVELADGKGRIYVGPKKYGLLRSLGDGLEQAVWFSDYASLAWIARHILFALLWIHDRTIPNYGLAIVLATFLLRLLLFPVNQYSMVSMKKTQLQMQRLQPKIKAIKAKYKKAKDSSSRAQMNQEMMDLYKREGVNPMGGVSGCLPMIAQIPILMSFYFMLTVAVELRGAPFFGWIHNLSVHDPYWVLPILMGATMFVQQKMAMSKVKDPVQQQQQKFMLVMPFVFTYICLQMPAGMVLYWFVNNLLGIGQQWLVNRHTTRLEAVEQKA